MFIVLLMSMILNFIDPDPIIIVHAESDFDGAARVAQEITLLSIQHKEIYLLTSTQRPWQENTEVPWTNPTKIIYAPSGFHDLVIQKKVTFTGGYFRACFANAVRDVVSKSSGPIEIHIPMKAVYFGGKRTLYEQFVLNFKSNEKDFIDYLIPIAKTQFGLPNPKIQINNTEIVIN